MMRRYAGAQPTFDHDEALHLWASDPLLTACEVALKLNVRVTAIHSLLGDARKRKDPRAIAKFVGNRVGVSRTKRLVDLREGGLSIPQMAPLVSRQPGKVRYLLKVHDRLLERNPSRPSA